MPAKRKSAFSAALREAQQQAAAPDNSITAEPERRITVKPQSGIIAQPQNRKTVEPDNSITVKPQSGITAEDDQMNLTEKTTLYLSPAQSDKLDELAISYKRRTRKRITRNTLLRKLIDKATIDDISEYN